MSQFCPRPEAQATTWGELMNPVSSAVRDLLVRIHGAHQSIDSKNHVNYTDSLIQETGNCFLVYGSRGTGKTTVLLNAQRAICKKSGANFFDRSSTETDIQKTIREDTKKIADNLKEGLVWLEILNLEPLPAEANLLTVLLTQVRNALHSHCDNRQSERRSIFEEDVNSARQQLNTLINDATLMWQNVVEADTRNITNRQVKAADIYAGFQDKFKKAMDKLVDELKSSSDIDKRLSIVLPIDNIDRSTDHLQAIVKLAQLVSHPNLWFVMAGDRVEVETFLERAYWKELIRNNDGNDALGKMDGEGEDEALVMARRQANATAQKLWPANHRVEVDLVTPVETLDFHYKKDSSNNKSVKISDLLGKINIPMTRIQREINQARQVSMITLMDLFDVSDEIIGLSNKIPNLKQRLTRTALHGLLLPARSVIDLWQLLDWLDTDISFAKNDFKAEKVARTMLRTAIASSDLSSKVVQLFQNDILQRGEYGGTILQFKKASLRATSIYSMNNDLKLEPVITPLALKNTKLRSKLVINKINDITLSLQQGTKNKQLIVLQPLVAAWLMKLYDILILAEGSECSWVSGYPQVKWFNVRLEHTIVSYDEKSKISNVKLEWNAPRWGVFWAHRIFRQYWDVFCGSIAPQQANLARLLAAGWVFCVLKTAVKLINSIDSTSGFENNMSWEFNNKDVQGFEKTIMVGAADFYRGIQEKLSEKKTMPDAAYEILNSTAEWLETELIFFLSSGYVPIESEESKTRFNALWDSLPQDDLLKHHWKGNLPFILADLDERLVAFDGNGKKIKVKPEKKPDSSTDDYNEEKTLPPAKLLFDDLYKKLESSGG